MILSKVVAVFRKDLKDVLRDRKTLIFMLLLPTLAIPLATIGVTRFVVSSHRKRAVQIVRIAIAPQDQVLLDRLMKERILSYDPGRILGLLRAVYPEGAERIIDFFVQLGVREDEALVRLMEGVEIEGIDAIKEDLEAFQEALRDKDVLAKLTPEQAEVLRKNYPFRILQERSEFLDPADLEGEDGRSSSVPSADYPPWVTEDPRVLALAEAITSKRIQAAVVFPAEMEEVLRDGKGMSKVRIYFDSTIPLSSEAEKRLRSALQTLARGFLQARLEGRGLTEDFIKPIEVTPSNVAPKRKQMQAAFGGLLPYIIILFCFLGAIYPALDLGAGEKERSTLETLLLSPASRYEIAAGKFLVILLTSMVAALLGLGSMYWTLTKGMLPAELVAGMDLSFDPLALVVSAFLTLPVAAIFASVLLSISIYARSFKEGQSYAMPLQFLIIIPAMASLIPDIEANWKIALIPVMNVSIVMREFMKRDYQWGFFGLTLFSTLLLAIISITFAARWFNREQVIFRA